MVQMRSSILCAAAGLVGVVASFAQAQLEQNWLARYSMAAGVTQDLPMGFAVDSSGAAYITGRSQDAGGGSQAVTVKVNPNGQVAWVKTYFTMDGLRTSGEGRGVGFAPNGDVLVTGLVAGPGSYGDVILLRYNAADGALIRASQVNVEYGDTGWCLASDAHGNVYVGGGTTGDSSDFLVVKFDSAGEVVWTATHDGSGLGPYSQDFVRKIAVTPDGHVVLTGECVEALWDDFVTIKLDATDGHAIWTNIYNSGGIQFDYPSDMVVDAAGDVYVTGAAGTTLSTFATVKIDGVTGTELWSHTDLAGGSAAAWGIALGPDGGVYISGTSDPDGNHSNFNDNFYTVKRRGSDGGLEWEALFGGNPIGQYERCNAVVVDETGRVFVGGRSATPPYTNDALIIEYDPTTGADIGHTVVEGVSPETIEVQFMGAASGGRLVVGGFYSNANTGNYDYFAAGLGATQACYANCDQSSSPPILNANDFQCFLNKFATGDAGANCDGSSAAPVLNANDFQCFLNQFAIGCS